MVHPGARRLAGALVPVLALAACGSDDLIGVPPPPLPTVAPSSSSPAEEPLGPPTLPARPTDAPPLPRTGSCKVRVQVTGAAKASWRGDGTYAVPPPGPATTYTAIHGTNAISVYAAADQIDPTVILAAGQPFSVRAPDMSRSVISPEGLGLEIDVKAESATGKESVRVRARFLCG